MTILVISEHDAQSIKPSTLATLGAANQLKQTIHVLVPGALEKTQLETLGQYANVEKIIQLDTVNENVQIVEKLADAIAQLIQAYDYILAPATTFGKNLLPRVAGLLEIGMLSDISEVIDEQTFVRPIYAGNAFATVKIHDEKKIITVRPTAFDAPEKTDSSASIEQLSLASSFSGTKFISLAAPELTRPTLDAADVVVSGGRGLQSKENFQLLEQLADKLNAAIGASRAAVDAGFVPNDYQVGQTGKIIAPKLYIGIGISGAIQHLAGMKDSKIIVAINKDEEAPIFQVADYGLVGDLFEVLPEMIEKLS